MKPLDPAMLRKAARVLVAALMDAGASAEIAGLLLATGRVAAVDPEYAQRVTTATARFAETLEQLLEAALREAVEVDEQLLENIRTWFVQPQDSYTVEELAAMLHITVDDALHVYHDEIVSDSGDVRHARIGWTAAVVTAAAQYGLIRPFDVERAFGNWRIAEERDGRGTGLHESQLAAEPLIRAVHLTELQQRMQ